VQLCESSVSRGEIARKNIHHRGTQITQRTTEFFFRQAVEVATIDGLRHDDFLDCLAGFLRAFSGLVNHRLRTGFGLFRNGL